MSSNPFAVGAVRVVRRTTALALILVASLGRTAPTEDGETHAAALAESARAPRRLQVSLVHSGPSVGTLQERIASWFPQTTEVFVTEELDVDQEQMRRVPEADEVKLWILLLSEQRALVVFAVADEPGSAKHLVRDVELENGLDELGLERLAFVIHSAVVALGEGSEATPRSEVERLLENEGVLQWPAPAPRAEPAAESGAAMDVAPETPVVPTFSDVPPPPVPPRSNTRAPQGLDALSTSEDTPSELRGALAAGYGVRFRGPEGTGHGPLVELAAICTSAPHAFALAGGGQLLLPSTFEAEGREVGLEAAHLYLGAAWRHQIAAGWTSEVFAAGGLDWVRIKPPPADRASDGSSFTPRAERSQQRPTAEGSVGLWYERPLFGVGLFLQTVVLIDEVEYRVQTESDERSVLSARRVQPGLVLRFRFPGRG